MSGDPISAALTAGAQDQSAQDQPAQGDPLQHALTSDVVPVAGAPSTKPTEKSSWQKASEALDANSPILSTFASLGRSAALGPVETVAKLAGRVRDVLPGGSDWNPGKPSAAATYPAAIESVVPQTGPIGQAAPRAVGSMVSRGVDAIPGMDTPMGQTLKEVVPEIASDVGLVFGGGALLNRTKAALSSGKITAGDALQGLRDAVGPDVVTHDANPMSDHGDTLIQAYKAKDAAATKVIDANYAAAREANGGDLQMRGQQFVADAKAALKPQGKGRFLPAEVQGILDDVDEAGGKMSLDDFVGYRTQLANAARKAERAGDGNAAAAIGKVRDALENVQPADDISEAAKALYDKAKDSAKARFDALRADPAYDAAVNDTVSGDKFFRRFVINGDRDNIGLMRSNLAGNDSALQTIATGTIDHLRAAGGVDAFGSGDFKAGPFNKAWRSLSPKRDVLFSDPSQPEYLDMLGGVTQSKPPTMVQKLGGHVADVAESVANVKAGGIPVGTATRAVARRVFPSSTGKVVPYQPKTLSELAGRSGGT